MMRKLILSIERGATLVNKPELVVSSFSERSALDLYDAVHHLFKFPSLKKRRYDTITWKTYYNLLMKRKGKLFGEKEGDEEVQNETNNKKKKSAPEQQKKRGSSRRENIKSKTPQQPQDEFAAAFGDFAQLSEAQEM